MATKNRKTRKVFEPRERDGKSPIIKNTVFNKKRSSASASASASRLLLLLLIFFLSASTYSRGHIHLHMESRMNIPEMISRGRKRGVAK
jgi:hypothetical protein